jgi:hypothetical protein
MNLLKNVIEDQLDDIPEANADSLSKLDGKSD